MAPPMTAKSKSCWASAPMVAPTSSTTLSPRIVGHSAAIAGRSILAVVFKQSFAIAINAPVLPADTAKSASPRLTASIDSHMLEFRRPRRKAWLGLSSMRTAMSQCTNSEASRKAGCSASMGSTTARSPNNRNRNSGRRVSAFAAPGITRLAPSSPPMTSSDTVTSAVIHVTRYSGPKTIAARAWSGATD